MWGVLPWLFLSLHCTGCESRGSHLTSHKNSGQMTVGLETERGKLRCLKNGGRVRLKNKTVTPACSDLWSKLDQQLSNENWVELSESKIRNPNPERLLWANSVWLILDCFYTLRVTWLMGHSFLTNSGSSCMYAMVFTYKIKTKLCIYTIHINNHNTFLGLLRIAFKKISREWLKSLPSNQLMDTTVSNIIHETLSPVIFKGPMEWYHHFLNVMYFLLK